MTKRVKYPFGKADVRSITSAATMAVSVENQETQITISQMTAAGTLNLDIDAEVEAGAELTIKVSADGTGRTLTFGTGMLGVAVAITASKTQIIHCKYMGGVFVVLSSIQAN